MLSLLHEATLALFRDRPTFAAELLTELLGTPVRAVREASVLSADVGQLAPTELRADLVLRYDEVCVVVEIQRGRDRNKRARWPVYVATLHDRLRCPVLLLVVVPTEALARWCREPIVVGGSFVLEPLVLGPDAIPRVTDERRARELPELAVLSAVAHAREADAPKLAATALTALETLVDRDRARGYTDLIVSALPDVARKVLEEIMAYQFSDQGEFAKKLRAEGKAEGLAQGAATARTALLAILELRQLVVTDEQRARIEAARLAELTRWIERAANVGSVNALLASS